jgi:hypothetical protein
MLRRAYEPLNAHLQPNKVLVIYGPRRVGKTTHLTQFLKSTPLKYKLDSGENFRTPQILGSQDFSQILADIGGCELVAIDAAQSIPNIGMGLKIIVDQEPGIQVVATGSSSFELAAQTGEPLTGRKRTRTLYPMAPSELLAVFNRMELREKLPEFLIFGLYPEVLQAPTRSAKIEAITEIANSCLLKDVLSFDRIKSSRTLLDLFKLLAFQVGSQVSFNEMASATRSSPNSTHQNSAMTWASFGRIWSLWNGSSTAVTIH